MTSFGSGEELDWPHGITQQIKTGSSMCVVRIQIVLLCIDFLVNT